MKKPIVTLTILFSIIFGFLGFVVAKSHFSYSIESKNEFYISNATDFIHYTKYYTAYDACYLSNNIEVSVEFQSIGSKENTYQAVFDGKGYCIKLKGNAQNTSLFNIIGEQGIVRNLEVKTEKCVVNTPAFGLVAVQNHGKITNVLVEAQELTIQKEAIVGGVVGVNYGEISLLYSNVNVKNNEGVSVVGAICGYNDGKINYTFSIITYTNVPEVIKENLLSGKVNNTYGFVYGINNKPEDVAECYYINEGAYVCSDRNNTKNLFNYLSTVDEEKVFNLIRFSSKVWSLKVSETNVLNFEIKDGVVNE